jgi:single-strand DNA-binding protein
MITNSVTLIGRVGRDPDIRTTRGGTKVADVSVATTERWKKAGEKKEHTEWHRVTVFGPLVDVFANHVKKGSLIAVSGKLRTEKWEDDNKKNHYTTSIIVDEMQLLGRAPASEDADEPAGDNAPLPDAKVDEIAQNVGEVA